MKNPHFKLLYINTVTFILIVIFSYTAFNKFLDIKSIQESLLQYPIAGSFPILFSWLIPIAEVLIVILLVMPQFRIRGIIASVLLLSGFTVFIAYMFSLDAKLPCTCGGMVSSLSWEQHITLNISLILAGIISLVLYRATPMAFKKPVV